MAFTQSFDVEDVLSKLTLEEKVALLSGAGRCAFASIERLNVPKINVRVTHKGKKETIKSMYMCRLMLKS